jgi:hypothetical protein
VALTGVPSITLHFQGTSVDLFHQTYFFSTVIRLSALLKLSIIFALVHSQNASIITTEEIPITIHKIDKIERSLFAKIEENHCFINISKFILNYYYLILFLFF